MTLKYISLILTTSPKTGAPICIHSELPSCSKRSGIWKNKAQHKRNLNAEFKLTLQFVSAGFNTFCRIRPSICGCFGKLLLELFDLFGAALTFLLRVLKAYIGHNHLILSGCKRPTHIHSPHCKSLQLETSRGKAMSNEPFGSQTMSNCSCHSRISRW